MNRNQTCTMYLQIGIYYIYTLYPPISDGKLNAYNVRNYL